MNGSFTVAMKIAAVYLRLLLIAVVIAALGSCFSCHPAKAANHPMSVWFAPALADSGEAAVKGLNDAIGCDALRVTASRQAAAIVVQNEGCYTAPHHAGCTFGTGYGTEINIAYPGDVTRAYLAILHELGHALGLDHVGYWPAPDPLGDYIYIPPFLSIMVPNAPEHATRLDLGYHLPGLSDADRSTLSEIHCR